MNLHELDYYIAADLYEDIWEDVPGETPVESLVESPNAPHVFLG